MAEQAAARKKIFISHSSQDKHVAEELCKALEMKGFGCWICTRDIEGGQNFAKAIVKAIKQSCLLILVFSKNANSSEFVEREVNHAVSNKIRLFPLKTENVEPSESLEFLIGLNQWLDIYDPPLEKHFPAIISAVAKLVQADEQIIEPAPVKKVPEIVLNPFEDNVEYIKIPGGSYKFSVTKKIETVPDLYFCKYLVTNKRYRKFISYLEGKEKSLEGIPPLYVFTGELLKLAATIKEYPEYLGTNPREWGEKFRPLSYDENKFNGDDQPVIGVSWYAARAYCYWLSCLQGKEGLYRLPTEKEWEWAAAGREPDGSLREYPWPKSKGEPTPELANYGGNVGATTPVGRYPEGATPEGLMDMAGNAWEWMENPFPENQNGRALRGGSWFSPSGYLRCAARDLNDPRSYWDLLGFRVVCEFAPNFESLKS